MQAIVRAIDVGFGNTKYVTAVDAGIVKCAHFPSATTLASEEFDSVDPLGLKRKTVAVAVDGLKYEVGPDIHLATNLFQGYQMHDGFWKTPEYMALVRAALYFMHVAHVDLLVLGLPVALYRGSRAGLEKRMTGAHPLPKGGPIAVDRVKVVAQPQGALLHFGVTQDRMAAMRDERNLVIDAGSRTFDWLVSQGLRVLEKRSSSVNRGMHDVVASIADGIGRVQNTQYKDYTRIDRALRYKTKPKIFGKEYDMTKHLRAAQKIAEDAVSEMIRFVGDGSDIDSIILVGGGAFFFRDAIKAAYPKHTVQELRDSLYSNVRGFQTAGEELVRAESERARKPTEATQSAFEA